MELTRGTPILVNARTQRVIPYTPPEPGREPASDRLTPDTFPSGVSWPKSMSLLYRDVPDHLWRIHGELYDLTEYLQLHPGGSIFLKETRGTDCTESFEVHHIRGVNPTLLQRYRLPGNGAGEQASASRFSYHESFSEIKRFVANYLEREAGNATGATPFWAGIMYSGIVLQFLLAFRLAVRRNSQFLAAIAGLLLTGVWGVGHNQIHRGRGRANAWRHLRFALELTGFSTEHQTVTHALSHHQNANTNYDVEVYEFNNAGLQWLTGEARNSWKLYQQVPGAFLLVASQTVVHTIVERLLLRIKTLDLLRTDVLLPAAMVGYASKQNGFPRGALLCWTMWTAFAAWFVPSSLSLHHSHDEESGAPVCYHEGEPTGFARDFAVHQIRSTRDHSPGLNHYASLVLFAHLNLHTIHHLFPCVDRVYHEGILHALLESNAGGFRDVYLERENNQDFWTLYKGVFAMTRNRRFEIKT